MKISELWRKLAKVHDSDSTDDDIGGLPVWFQSGSGSPVGTVTPSQQGALYQDTTNGALFTAVGLSDVDWYCLGGLDVEYSDLLGMSDDTSEWQLQYPADRTLKFVAKGTVRSIQFTGFGLGAVFDDGTSFFVNRLGGMTFPTANTSLFWVLGVPDNAVGLNGSWAISENGHFYFKTGGSWVEKV